MKGRETAPPSLSDMRTISHYFSATWQMTLAGTENCLKHLNDLI